MASMKEAVRATAAQIAEEKNQKPVLETVRFRIDGMHIEWVDSYTDGVATQEQVIVLKDVPKLDIRWDQIGEILEDSGLSKDDSMLYVDSFAQKVQQDQLAKFLAKKIRYA